MWVTISVLAQEVNESNDLLGELIRNGVLGLVIVGLITGWLHTKPEHDRMMKDHDAQVSLLKDEIRELRERNRKLVDDAITRSSRKGFDD